MNGFDARWRALAARAAPDAPAPAGIPDAAALRARAARRRPAYALAWWVWPVAAAALVLAITLPRTAPATPTRPTAADVLALGSAHGLLDSWPRADLIPALRTERP